MGLISIRTLTIALISSCLCLTFFSPPASAQDTAEPINALAQVELFHSALMASARLDDGYDARVDSLGAAFDKVFDVSRIARISAGAAWRSLDESTKTQYSKLLRSVLLGTYVSRFDADRGQRIEVLEARQVKPGRDLVRAQIIRPSGVSVALVYYLRDNLIFNVEADGVSDLSIRRADYASIINAEGFTALIAHLNAQVAASRTDFSTAEH